MRLLRRFGCRFVVIRLELVLIYSILLLMLVLQVGLGVSYDKLLRLSTECLEESFLKAVTYQAATAMSSTTLSTLCVRF